MVGRRSALLLDEPASQGRTGWFWGVARGSKFWTPKMDDCEIPCNTRLNLRGFVLGPPILRFLKIQAVKTSTQKRGQVTMIWVAGIYTKTSTLGLAFRSHQMNFWEPTRFHTQ